MNKWAFLFLLGALFAGCSSDEEEFEPFVSEVVMPSSADSFDPGDEVRVEAQGFHPGDEIMFDIRWPIAGQPSEGYARGVWGILTRRTQTSLTFLAPGHYPASTVEVLLRRAGRMMPLGTIFVTDGQSPETATLYGITHSASGSTVLERFDLASGEGTLMGSVSTDRSLLCAVNVPGSNCIYGISARDGSGVGVCYDLTMRLWRDSEPETYLAAGKINESDVTYFRYEEGLLIPGMLNLTRTSVENPVSWELPDGVKAETLNEYPFTAAVSDGSACILFAANRGDGTFLPVTLTGSRADMEKRAQAGDPVVADAMIPFRVLKSVTVGNRTEVRFVAGYAVSSGGVTKLMLYDPSARSFGETLGELPHSARSLAVACDAGVEKQSIYLLCDAAGDAKQIVEYDPRAKTSRVLVPETHCSEIVLAR